MWSILVVVLDEFCQDGDQVLLAEHDQVVEALSAECPDDFSATAFARGARTGVVMPSIPIRLACWRKMLLWFVNPLKEFE